MKQWEKRECDQILIKAQTSDVLRDNELQQFQKSVVSQAAESTRLHIHETFHHGCHQHAESKTPLTSAPNPVSYHLQEISHQKSKLLYYNNLFMILQKE